MSSDRSQSGLPAATGDGALLQALWLGAERLILAEDLVAALPEALSRLGPAVRACLAAYDEISPGADGEAISTRRACWADPSAGIDASLQPSGPVPMRAACLGRFLDRLLSGEMVVETPEDGDGETRHGFGTPGIRSHLVIPLRADGRLAGALVCARQEETGWTPAETAALQRFAHLLGALRQRQEAWQALATSEERHRRVIEAAREYLWETDAEGRVTFVSDRVREILGYAPEEIVGRLVFEFLAPDALERARPAFEAAVAAQEPFRGLEGVALHRDGRSVPILTNGYPRIGPGGALLGYTGTTADISERKRAEQTLRESEARYRSLVESQSDLIMRWSPDGRLTYANEAFCRFFGYEREKVLGRSMLELARPSDREAVARLAAQLSHPPYGPAIEERAPSVDGPRRISWKAHPVRDETGRLVEMQSVGRDVTDAHRAETELRRKDNILQAIGEAAEELLETEPRAGAADAADPLGRLLERLGRATEVPRLLLLRTELLEGGGFALRLERMWLCRGAAEPPPWPDEVVVPRGPDAARLIRLARTDRIHDLRREDAPEPIGSLMHARGVRSMLIVSILVDAAWWGSLVLPSLEAPRIWSPDEREALRTSANLIAASIRRQRIETALRESEERYRTLVEGASQPILIVDRDGRFRFANRYACEQIQLRPEEIVGRTLWETHPKEHADAHFAVIRRALETGDTTGSIRQTMIAGQRRWYFSHVQPLPEYGDGREAVLILLRDVTDLKLQEEQILEYQRQLQALTTELALVEQRERLQIATGLHDGVGQSLALARMRLGLARQVADGQVRGEALDDAIRLIEESIEETRSLIFELSPPVLRELGLEPALEWLAERYQDEGRLEVRFEGDGRPVTMAPELLGFVFQSVRELLLNAVKHAQASSVLLRKHRTDQSLAIEVADDGVGYDPAGIGRSSGGFGLISIRERLRHLGGSLEIESRRGKGTKATVRVPLPEPKPEKETER